MLPYDADEVQEVGDNLLKEYIKKISEDQEDIEKYNGGEEELKELAEESA